MCFNISVVRFRVASVSFKVSVCEWLHVRVRPDGYTSTISARKQQKTSNHESSSHPNDDNRRRFRFHVDDLHNHYTLRPDGYTKTLDSCHDFDWKLYLATHDQAAILVGPGVIDFSVAAILGTDDPNRRGGSGGHQRVDFLVRRCDGTAVRLHPGTRPKNDAAPCFYGRGTFSAAGQASGAGALMYDAERVREEAERAHATSAAQPVDGAAQPVAASAVPVFAMHDATAVPQQDYMGRDAARRCLAVVLDQRKADGEARPPEVDVTESASVPW